MPVRKYLARDYNFSISLDNRATWTPISGISTWGLTIDSNEEDTGTFDNGGWGSAMYTQRTGSMSLEGFFLVDSSTGTRDPGQAAVDGQGTKIGYAAYCDFRVRAVPSGYGEIGNFVFTGQVGPGDRGGSVTDVDPWSAEILFEGKPTGSGIFSYLV
jgi:hypothetical protein